MPRFKLCPNCSLAFNEATEAVLKPISDALVASAEIVQEDLMNAIIGSVACALATMIVTQGCCDDRVSEALASQPVEAG